MNISATRQFPVEDVVKDINFLGEFDAIWPRVISFNLRNSMLTFIVLHWKKLTYIRLGEIIGGEKKILLTKLVA